MKIFRLASLPSRDSATFCATFCGLIFLNMSVFTQPPTQAAALPKLSDSKTVETKILGRCTPHDLNREPYSGWFTQGVKNYIPDTGIMAQLQKASLRGVSAKIFFGTWCGDSKREVPKMYKVLREAGLTDAHIEFIAVDDTDSVYKQSPTHEERGYDIFRVPTLILERENKETGRIVESPAETTERDILHIVRNATCRTCYASYPIIVEWLKSGVLADTNTSIAGLVSALRFQAGHESELNSCGYVLSAQGKIREAATIFRINTFLFPGSSNCFAALGEARLKEGNKEAALRAYEKALELNPKNINALNALVSLRIKL